MFQIVCFIFDDVKIPFLFFRRTCYAGFYSFKIRFNHRKRRAQIVGNTGDELAAVVLVFFVLRDDLPDQPAGEKHVACEENPRGERN